MSEPIAIGWKELPTFILAEAHVTRDHDGLVRIPYRNPVGELVNRRVFAPSGKCWWERSGVPMVPFGLERLEEPAFRRYRVLALAEGESDSLALDAAFGAEGMDVLGVPGALSWKSDWLQYVEGYETVYVFGDGDQAGREFSIRVRRHLPRAGVVSLPDGEDVRSLLQGSGPDAVVATMEEADRLLDLEALLRSGEVPHALAA